MWHQYKTLLQLLTRGIYKVLFSLQTRRVPVFAHGLGMNFAISNEEKWDRAHACSPASPGAERWTKVSFIVVYVKQKPVMNKLFLFMTRKHFYQGGTNLCVKNCQDNWILAGVTRFWDFENAQQSKADSRRWSQQNNLLHPCPTGTFALRCNRVCMKPLRRQNRNYCAPTFQENLIPINGRGSLVVN